MFNQHSLGSLTNTSERVWRHNHPYLHSGPLPGRANWGMGSPMTATEQGCSWAENQYMYYGQVCQCQHMEYHLCSQRTAQTSKKGVNLSKFQIPNIVEGQKYHGTWSQNKGVSYTLGFEETI